jgi:hypothetical protein
MADTIGKPFKKPVSLAPPTRVKPKGEPGDPLSTDDESDEDPSTPEEKSEHQKK